MRILSLISLLLLIGCGQEERARIEFGEPIAEEEIDINEFDVIEDDYFNCESNTSPVVSFSFKEKVDRVQIVAYAAPPRQYNQDDNMERDIVKDEKIGFDDFLQIVLLDSSQISELNILLQKYSGGKYSSSDCYNPLQCIHYLDKNDNVLGHLEICFSCGGQQGNIDGFRLQCDDHFDEMKSFMKRCGLNNLNRLG
ncbi:MAG: hypothetical protein COB65_10985 [Thalassobium sp.]|nr:MAG: hypothetical protein COB65_10985 [Thalassobium sp.]